MAFPVKSDRGPQFISWFWREFGTALGAKVALSSDFHPQTNGQTERMNQKLKATLRCICSSHLSAWSIHLLWVEYAHNSNMSSVTGLSPFESSLGYQPPLFPSDELDLAVASVRHHLWRCCASGIRPSLHSIGLLTNTGAWWIEGGCWPQNMLLVKRCGSPYVTEDLNFITANSPPGSLVRSKSSRSSVPPLFTSASLTVSKSTRCSMSPWNSLSGPVHFTSLLISFVPDCCSWTIGTTHLRKYSSWLLQLAPVLPQKTALCCDSS